MMDSSTLLLFISVSLVLASSIRSSETSLLQRMDTVEGKKVFRFERINAFKADQHTASPSKTLVRERRELGWFSVSTEFVSAIERVLGVGLEVAEKIKNEKVKLYKNTLKTNKDIMNTNTLILKMLQNYESKIEELNNKLDWLPGASLDIKSKITISSIKKDFDLLYRARQWIRQQKLVEGVYRPMHLFRYKTEDDYNDIQYALINLNSYLTEQRPILDNKILAAWLVDSSTTCQSIQYMQVLAVQATGYEWWKILSVALCQQYDKGIGSCHVENVETVKAITTLQVTLIKKQQEALDKLLLQYMSAGRVENGNCVIKMGARLGGRNSRNTMKLFNYYFRRSAMYRYNYYKHRWTPLHWARKMSGGRAS